MQNHYLNVITKLQQKRYIIIGGFAAIMYGSDRFTPDLNLVIDFDPSNTQAIIKDLTELGLRHPRKIDPNELNDSCVRSEWMERYNWRFLPFESPSITGFRVEIALNPDPPYATLISDVHYAAIDNISVPLCSYQQLCAMKTRANRAQDLVDLENLSFADKLRKTNNDPSAVEQLVQEYSGKFEPERLEHLKEFGRQTMDTRIEWLGNMLQAIGKSMLGQFH